MQDAHLHNKTTLQQILLPVATMYRENTH